MDLAAACRLIEAIDALTVDPLARPLVRELREHLEAARGHVASVTDINAERAKREREE